MSTTQETMSTASTINLRLKSVFELSDEELQERLRPTFEAVKQQKFAKGGYITYHDPVLCRSDDHMIHECRDRKELVKLDDSGKALLVKIV